MNINLVSGYLSELQNQNNFAILTSTNLIEIASDNNKDTKQVLSMLKLLIIQETIGMLNNGDPGYIAILREIINTKNINKV